MLEEYFRETPDRDAAWAAYFLCGRRRKRLISTGRLREWAAAKAGIPDWLFEESYHYVGDLAETTALLLPEPEDRRETAGGLADFVERHLLSLTGLGEDDQREHIERTWRLLDYQAKLVYHKMLTGGFRIGVQRKTVENALGNLYGIDPAVIAHRMMGNWSPEPSWFRSLRAAASEKGEPSLPYPFCLAHPVEAATSLGLPSDWQVEPKWDGIRAQLIVRGGHTFLWSRGEETVAEAFPEISDAASRLPDGTVLDGEILVWRDDRSTPEPFGELQKRLGRKTVTSRTRTNLPVRFLAYDLLELDGTDRRDLSTLERRRMLEGIFPMEDSPIQLSPVFRDPSWEDLRKRVKQSRENGIEGVILKKTDAPYRAGRVRGAWWKWKVEPLRIDAVLVYAQTGHGRRSGLFTDYTFSVYQGRELVPVAKAYSGLTDKEIRELDRWIKSNTLEKFGPVRSVPPVQVFEIAFDAIRESKRHKAGLALRFPRISRWRKDKMPDEIDRIETLREMMGT